jgi:hypothetical protein
MKAFLLVFDSSAVSRDAVHRKLDAIPEITNWYSILDNSFCLASDQDAKWLAARLRDDVIPETRFIVTEVEKHKKGGWLPREIWEFLARPKPVKSSAA